MLSPSYLEAEDLSVATNRSKDGAKLRKQETVLQVPSMTQCALLERMLRPNSDMQMRTTVLLF